MLAFVWTVADVLLTPHVANGVVERSRSQGRRAGTASARSRDSTSSDRIATLISVTTNATVMVTLS
jgi:hypothetical protein